MGAAMAPAAFDTIAAHFRDTQTTEADFDAIYTGDLGKLGLSMLCDMLADEGAEDMTKFRDCGAEFIYAASGYPYGGQRLRMQRHYTERKAIAQAMGAAIGSGYCSFLPGALLSTTSSMQGNTIPGIAHAVRFERRSPQ